MTTKPHKTLLLIWPLLAGLAMIMTGNGLQGTLLGLRAEIEGFSLSVIGIVMSLYYCGYMIGCYTTPKMIRSVGHIRVFAAMASLASVTILANGMFPDPIIWGIFRAMAGASFAALFIVSESWLNNIAPNRMRAQIFGAYIFVINGGLFAGQFLIGLAPVIQIDLFVLVSVLISLSLVPITLANKPSPAYQEPQNLPFLNLLKLSPLSLFGVFCSGFVGASVLTLGPAYAHQMNLSNVQTAHFIASYILGCAVMPPLVGWLSDRLDRRLMIITLAVLAMVCTSYLALIGHPSLPGMFALGGLNLCIYSIAVAYMNDRLEPGQIISASTSMILMNGFGAILGPVAMGTVMQWGRSDLFYAVPGTIFGLLATLGLIRIIVNRQAAAKRQKYVSLPPRSGHTALDIADK